MTEEVEQSTPNTQEAPPVDKAQDHGVQDGAPPSRTPPPNTQISGASDVSALEGSEDTPSNATWPDDWKTQIGGEDDGFTKWLNRFGSVNAAMRSGYEANQRIRSGQYKQAELPESPTEKELADFRKSHGIPETIEGYQENVKLPDGFELDESEQEVFNGFLSSMHENNIPPQHAKAAVDFWSGMRAREEEEMYAHAQKLTEDYRVELRSEYGRDYRANTQIANNYLSKHSEGKAADLASMTLSDGTKLGDNPLFVRTMVNMARDANGEGALVETEYQTRGQTMEARYHDLLALRNSSDENDRRRYHSDEVQKELQRIAAAKAAKSTAA